MKTQRSVYNNGTDRKGVRMRCGTTYTLDALERAGISYLPCTFDQPLVTYKHLWGKRRQVTLKRLFPKSAAWALKGMTGVQLITGEPTHRPSPTSPNGYIFLTDIDIESALLKRYPEIAEQMIALYSDSVLGEPCIIETKSGGRRLSAFCAYLDPKREFHDKTDGKMLMEFFSLKGLSRIDERYAMLQGSLLDIPILEKRVLQEIYKIVSDVSTPKEQADRDTRVVEESQLGDLDIRWDAEGKSQYFLSEYCQATSHRSNRLTVQFARWSGGVQGHCFNCGTSWWEVPPPPIGNRKEQIEAVRTGELSPLALHRLPSKLQKDEQFSAVVDTLAKAREKIAEILKSTARVFGLRADTGVGKNYETASYVLNGGALLQTSPTSELAVELESRMAGRGIDVFRYRGLMYHWQDGEDVHLRFPHDAPCIQAARCESYRQKGGNFYQVICPGCPVIDECTETGYRSQQNQAAMAAAVLMPIPDAFTNPTYRGHIKFYLDSYMDTERLCIVDEADVFKLFVECTLTNQHLKAVMEMWDGHVVAEFAETLLTLLEVKNEPYKIGAVLEALTETEIKTIRTRLRQVKVDVPSALGGVESRVMSLDDAVKGGYLSAFSEAEIAALPQVDGDWGLVEQLQAFFSYYKRPEDAPMAYREGVLRWMVPPVVHQRVWKLGLMSATLDGELLRRALPDAEMHDLPPVDWVDGARVYQLRTHKAPRRTVYERADDGNLIGFSSTGQRLWHSVEQEIRSTPEKKHAIISYKQVLEWIRPEIEELEIAAVANFGGLVGLDTKFENVDTLWVLFSPELPPSEVEWRAKMLFGNDDATLPRQWNQKRKKWELARDVDGNYTDLRVQKIYDAGVISELVQAVGRARLLLHASEVVILSAHSLQGITDRAVLFDETDWEVAGGLSNLARVVAEREQAESKAAELTGENTVADFQQAYGCSERHARRLWEEAGGKDSKADKDAELLQHIEKQKAQNIGERKIAKMLGISRGKLQGILRKNRVD